MNKGLLLSIIVPFAAALRPSFGEDVADGSLLRGNHIVSSNPEGDILLGNYESEEKDRRKKNLPEVEH